MSITDDLLGAIEEDASVESVIVGAHWTLVTTSRGAGLASTLPDAAHPHGMESVPDAGRLVGRSGLELAEMLRSSLPLERSIGMAAVNGLLNVDERRCEEINAEDWLRERGKGKRVAVVGHFPFVPRLREVAETLWTLEQRPGEGDLPAGMASEVLPQAEVVAITGVTLINNTLEGLLPLCSPQAEVMLVGPTAPLAPVLHEHGLKAISGTRVVDPQKVAAYVAQGAVFRQIKRSSGVRLLTMIDDIN